MKEESNSRNLLILLENENQYCEFQRRKDRFNDCKCIFCALTPFARNACERDGLDFVVPEECFNETEYYRYKEISETTIYNLAESLNKYSSRIGMERIGFPIEIGNYFFFCLYTVMGDLHFRSFFITKVIEKLNPKNILVFKRKEKLPEPPPYIYFFLQGFFDIYFNMLSNSSYGDICVVLEYSDKGNAVEKTILLKSKFKESMKSIVARMPLVHNLYYLWKNKIGLTLNAAKSRKRMFLIGPMYNWRHILNHPRMRPSISIYGMDGNELPKADRDNQRDLFKKWLDWDNRFLGFDLAPLMYRHMGTIKSTMSQMLRSFARYKRIISKMDCVLASVFVFPRQHYIAHIANQMQKPVVIYQHGEKNFHPEQVYTEIAELLYADYCFTFGTEVNSLYNRYIGKLKNFKRPIPVGSATLDMLSSIKDKQQDYILYATGKYFGGCGPFINSIGPDSRLYDAQEKILSFLKSLKANNPSYKIVWKLNNTLYASDVPFKADGIQTIHFEKSFQDLIHNAAFIILDAPATTCLEACSSHKPLFVLQNRIEWFEKTRMLLEKRAVVASTPEDLIARIDDYIRTGVYPADRNNRDFIKAYGTYLDDGRSSDRAIETLFSILDNTDKEG